MVIAQLIGCVSFLFVDFVIKLSIKKSNLVIVVITVL